MGITEHFTYFLRNLYVGQKTTARAGQRTTDCFKTEKAVHQGYILSPCLFNFNTENIVQNAWVDEALFGIKISRRNINNLRYADDTTLMAENEEELKRLLIKVKEKNEKKQA